ncbi:hypothetical protein TNIN_463441 [Trichonephila inaurata madagascariensis]|uniref:Uncharacterized protein n=1 Tax=Trichonephila inaurata madagascariensis TaxID=2747483 RepID=A0A8X6I872_9ARAC|nr:hypothetical protein TNIN_132881 [Trichonephila inaurata madagascariensis]GFY53533.1 hypothetical protein TNIN_463441 [Trichonephila inaurata madagascariensis]
MCDNDKHLPRDHPNHDRLNKIRPLYDELNKNFAKVPLERHLSIDEQICSTKVKDWINNLNLENNLLAYIYEENGDGEINSPVSDIAVWDNIQSANKLSVDAVKTLETPKQHTPFKISTITLSDEKESFVGTSDKSWSNDKGDAINFSNADFEADEPELIEIFKNSIERKDRFPLFKENYHFFPISTEETQDAAVTDVSEIMETSKLSTPNKYLKKSFRGKFSTRCWFRQI